MPSTLKPCCCCPRGEFAALLTSPLLAPPSPNFCHVSFDPLLSCLIGLLQPLRFILYSTSGVILQNTNLTMFLALLKAFNFFPPFFRIKVWPTRSAWPGASLPLPSTSDHVFCNVWPCSVFSRHSGHFPSSEPSLAFSCDGAGPFCLLFPLRGIIFPTRFFRLPPTQTSGLQTVSSLPGQDQIFLSWALIYLSIYLSLENLS